MPSQYHTLLGTLLLFFCAHIQSALSTPLGGTNINKTIRQEDEPFSGPVIESDFPDPSIIKVNGTWFAFGTQSIFDYKDIRVQVASTVEEGGDFDGDWKLWEGRDALASLPLWASQSNPQVWAPSVQPRDDGSYILFFSALANSTLDPSNRLHCFGTAISTTSVTGPYYSNTDTPFACPLDRGGAIDAATFQDDDAEGTRYVLYKIDGNARGNGGSCGNTVEPLASTPIMIQRVEADWVTPIGEAVQILDRGEFDGPLVEAPAMVKVNGVYILFFSSNCYFTDLYDTSYATSRSPTEGFAKAKFPLLISGTIPGTAGPGHADVVVGSEGRRIRTGEGEIGRDGDVDDEDAEGMYIAFHAYASLADVGGRRAMFVRRLVVGGDVVSLGRD